MRMVPVLLFINSLMVRCSVQPLLFLGCGFWMVREVRLQLPGRTARIWYKRDRRIFASESLV